MIFTLFEININWKSTSWFELCIFLVGNYNFALFSIEFDGNELVHFDIFGIKEIMKVIRNRK